VRAIAFLLVNYVDELPYVCEEVCRGWRGWGQAVAIGAAPRYSFDSIGQNWTTHNSRGALGPGIAHCVCQVENLQVH